MKRTATLFLAGLFCAVFWAPAIAQPDDRYDRYERGGPPREMRGAPPPRAAYAPPPQHAVHGQPYFFAHLGLFEPNDEADGLRGYDSGGSFDVGFGSRVSPILAVEGTFGAYGADGPVDAEVAVLPVTFGLRLVIPHPFLEPYVGAGVGLYFANLEEPAFGIDDSDATFGGYGSAGIDAWLNRRVALNFEARYHWAEPEFDSPLGSVDVDVSGWIASMGVRVSF